MVVGRGGGKTENKRVKRVKQEEKTHTMHKELHSSGKLKDSNMEVVRQVLRKSVSGNWERGITTWDQPSGSLSSSGQAVRARNRGYKDLDD